jgi:hypothetical protein
LRVCFLNSSTAEYFEISFISKISSDTMEENPTLFLEEIRILALGMEFRSS